MGETRDLIKKIRATKGTFHAKKDTIKDRNGMDQTEAEDIKRWQEYTEELYKKDLHDPDNHDSVIKSKVKWALGSITTNKASGTVNPSATSLNSLAFWQYLTRYLCLLL